MINRISRWLDEKLSKWVLYHIFFIKDFIFIKSFFESFLNFKHIRPHYQFIFTCEIFNIQHSLFIFFSVADFLGRCQDKENGGFAGKCVM